MNKDYQIKIGLETHIELSSASKMFSDAPNDPFHAEPNANLTPVCVGMPGTLPVPNVEAIKQTILFGLALNCQIPAESKFDRKHYFYPDLPKGYQISQYDQPLCLGGEVKFGEQTVRLTRIHLEEDAGKLLHTKTGDSLVDLNRAGVPLMEVVSEPDITSAAMARAYLQELRLIARRLKISAADMEKGQLRCDANVSIKAVFGGKRVASYISEIKNLNSFRMVERAIIYEAERLYEELKTDPQAREKKTKITVGWDNVKQQTNLQRAKEGSADYRYFPEPDIPPLRIYNSAASDSPPADGRAFLDVAVIAADLVRLPGQEREALVADGIAADLADIMVKKPWMLSLWQALKQTVEAQQSDLLQRGFLPKAANILVHDASEGISATNLIEITLLALDGQISSDIPKKALALLSREPNQSATALVQAQGWQQLHDEGQLKQAINKVVAANPKPVTDFKAGKENSLGFLVGQVMQQTKGQANPQLVQQLLREALQ